MAQDEVEAIRQRCAEDYRHEPGEQYTPMLRDLRFLLGVLKDPVKCVKCGHNEGVDGNGVCLSPHYEPEKPSCLCYGCLCHCVFPVGLQPETAASGLLLCPFCPFPTKMYLATRTVGWQGDAEFDTRRVVVCGMCGAQGPAFGVMSFNNDETAAGYWNRRAPETAASRVVNVKLHGEPTQTRLREIQASVANGYEAEYRKLGWSRLSQTMLRDLHFLLTFFSTDTPVAPDTAEKQARLLRFVDENYSLIAQHQSGDTSKDKDITSDVEAVCRPTTREPRQGR